MRLLLDTHAFIWWIAGSERLPQSARSAISDEANEKFVSAASAWEITTKYRLGKLLSVAAVALDVSGAIASQGFDELLITVDEGAHAGSLPGPHRDPFDRMLIAQALSGNLVLVSNEPLFDQFGPEVVQIAESLPFVPVSRDYRLVLQADSDTGQVRWCISWIVHLANE